MSSVKVSVSLQYELLAELTGLQEESLGVGLNS